MVGIVELLVVRGIMLIEVFGGDEFGICDEGAVVEVLSPFWE